MIYDIYFVIYDIYFVIYDIYFVIYDIYFCDPNPNEQETHRRK